MGALETLAATRRHKMNTQEKIEYQELTREACETRIRKFYKDIKETPALEQFYLKELESGIRSWKASIEAKHESKSQEARAQIADLLDRDISRFYDAWFEIDEEMSDSDYYVTPVDLFAVLDTGRAS